MSLTNIEVLRYRAHTLRMGFFFRLDEYVEDYAAGDPQKLIGLFQAVLNELRPVIESSESERQLNLISHALCDLSESALVNLDHANSAQTPRGLVQPLEWLRDRILKGSLLIVSPRGAHTYTITNLYPEVRKLVRRLLQNDSLADNLLGPFRAGINVVCFPRVERENILLHAIFGHEFGHPAADSFLEVKEGQKTFKRKLARIRNRIDRNLPSRTTGNRYDRNETLTETYGDVVKMHRRGLQELVSDACAALIFGPSALFAMADMLVPDGLDTLPSAPDYYPPTRFRLRLLHEVLHQQGEQLRALSTMRLPRALTPVREATQKRLKMLKSLAESTQDRDALASSLECELAYEWLEETLPSAIRSMQKQINLTRYSVDLMNAEVPQCLERLLFEIPPGEIGSFPDLRSVDWRSAILAGWMHQIYQVTRTDIKWTERSAKVARGQTLTLKGIEDAFLKTEYDRAYPVSNRGH